MFFAKQFERLSVQTQILTIVVAIVLLSAGLISFFALRSANSILRKEAIESVGSAANIRRERLLARLSSRRNRTLASLNIASQLCEARSHNCIRRVFENYVHSIEIAGLQFIPRHGPRLDLGLPASHFSAIPLPKEGELARFGRGSDGQVYFVEHVTNALGEVTVEFPISEIESIFGSADLGDTGESFLTDDRGYFLTKSRFPSLNGNTHPIHAMPMLVCLSHRDGQELGYDYHEREVVHGFRYMPEIGGGCIMAHIDQTEAFHKSAGLAHYILAVMLVTVLLASLLALFAARLITRPIQRLVENAVAFQRGDFAQKIKIEGPIEIQTFGKAFADMAETLINEIQVRKLFQHESEQQKAQFEAVFNSISDAAVVVDLERTVILANPAFYSMFGLTPPEVLGVSSRQIYPSEEEFRNLGNVLATLTSGAGKVFGIRFQRKNGETFASETMVSRVTDSHGTGVGYIAIIRDISLVKEAQSQLQQSEERFRRAVVDAPIPIMIRTEDGQILQINKVWTQITGYSLEEIPTVADWTAKAYPNDLDNNRERIHSSSLISKRTDLGVFKIRTKLGNELLWHFIVAPLGELPDGRKLIISMASDITDLKRSEAELSKAVNSRDDFLATLSHELRTPMNIILGWLDILKANEANLDGKVFSQALETLRRNAKVQKDLIDDLLDVSRIISGKFTLSLQPTDLTQIVRQISDSMRPRVEEKGITLVSEVPNQPVIVAADSTKLTQVVVNLLQNAFKFTPSGGRIEIHLMHDSRTANLFVKDSGVGIEADFLPHVFDRLKQEDMGTTRAHSGLGLGLAISRHIVEQHKGSIRAASPGRGHGATFEVRLPLSNIETKPSPQTDPLHRAVESEKLTGFRVLVVDDSADILYLMRLWLEQTGAQVFTAENANEGLQLLIDHPIDVLVSDIGMPGEDGYRFLKKVRALEAPKCEVPAAALTAYAREEERDRALSAGFQTHIAKPTNKATVVATVCKLIARMRAKTEPHHPPEASI